MMEYSCICCRENSSYPESCKNGICSTSPEEMTSVRTCYCKQEENVSRKKDGNITDENRHIPIAVSKRLVIKNKACTSNRESPMREKSDEKMMQPKNRSVEVQSDPVLSPETSTALENAEKIINNAKIQLMEVCAMSSLDSVRRNRNTCSEPPLDDETEELLYIRELVASKFYETSSSRSEGNERTTSAPSENRSPQITVRRVDLSAPKFRMSRRRQRGDRYLEYGSERASPTGGPSRGDDSSSSSSSSSAGERELVRARENACEIQIGPSLHIVDRELTRQDLEDVHISPDSSWCRANTATYVLRRSSESPVTSADKEESRKRSGAPKKTLRVRLDTSRRQEPVPETEATRVCATTIVSEKGDSNRERLEPSKSQVRSCINGEEKRETDTRDTRMSESLETNREAINPVVIENSGADRERSQDEAQVKIISRDETNPEGGRMFDVDCQAYLRNEESAMNGMPMKNQSDRSKPLPDNDTSRKAEFPRLGNIEQAYRAVENSRSRRTQIDERFSNTFDSHNGQDELCDVAVEDTHHRSFVSNCIHDFPIKDILNEVDLYRPRLNDLDLILLSNDKKIERVVHATQTFGELLSRLDFATCGNEEKQTSGEFHHESSADKVLQLSSKESNIETELKNADLTVSCVPSEKRTDTNMRKTDTIGMESSGFTKESDSRSKYSKNSMESSVFPGSDTSYGSEIKSSRDKVQQPRLETHLSESSSYKSDVTTFSNMVPAFSSTRTETQTCEKKQIPRDNRHGDAGRLVLKSVKAVKRSSEIDCSRKEFDHIFTQIPRKDTSEAADRFVAYFLQDEKQSVENKVANALKESAMDPVAVQKFLDNMRNAKREAETLDILKNILIEVQPEPETKESIGDSRNISELDKINADETLVATAIEGSIPRVKDQLVEQIAEKSHDKPDELSRDSSACRGTREDAASLHPLESAQSSKNNHSKGISYSEAESLKQISDIRSDDDALPCKNSPPKTVSAKSNEGCTMEAEDLDIKIAESTKNQEDDATNERPVGNESSDVQEAVKEITIEETRGNTSVNENIVPAKILEMMEGINLDAKSAESIETPKKEDVNLAHSPAKEDIEALCAIEECKSMINSRHSVVKEKVDLVANSCSASLRDNASLSSAKNGKSLLKEVASHNIKPNITVGENDLIKDRKNDDKSMTVDDRRNGTEVTRFLKNIKNNDEEQSNDLTLQEQRIDILSNSNSSVSSILLDYDNRSTNGAFSANPKRMETSSETSHSEGELYMPSSCSYSLGEVRVLKKRELISDNSIDRDSSATILVTRSMLTSLNNSTISLLESSGCI
ncbi:uncharacterized protein LOC114942857 [Nylanderia fulva]|uniref:uncharacterized protein LOC114942857 n=1 Tax=Nylanderia fulva TaxID=613905 RepID=UPI0010FB6FB5|nr:uncharacterized protein LOC114942857 [Nylanderia fulva]